MLYDNGEKYFVLLSGVGEDMGKYLHKPCVKTAQNCDSSVFSYLICYNTAVSNPGKHLYIIPIILIILNTNVI